MNMLAASSWVQFIVAFLFIAVCILLILVILLQKGRGGGLSGAFGGVGGHSAFGTKTGDVFTWITVGLTFMFVLMSVFGSWTFVPSQAAAPPDEVQAAPGSEGTATSETPDSAPAN